MSDRELSDRLRRMENQIAALAHYQTLVLEILKSLIRSPELAAKIDSYILSLRSIKRPY